MKTPFEKIKADLSSAANQKAVTELQERIAHYKAKSEQLDSQLRAYQKQAGKTEELVTAIVKSVKAYDPYTRVPYKHNPDRKRSAVAFVAKTSDWQIGEVIAPNEIEGFNAFNWKIAQERVASLAQKQIDDILIHRDGGFPIDEIHVFDEGDPVSGNIHYELEVTNEFPVTQAAVNSGMLFAEYISQLAPHAKKVIVHRITADNHGRLTRKNQFKQGGINNWAYIAHTISTAALKKHSNVTIEHSQGTTLLADVVGKKFLIKHGHTVKAWNGIPLYGLEREAAREARRRMNTPKEFHYLSIGHFHVPMWVTFMLVNGSLPGTTELDHALGRHAPPSQVSFFVHPKHGVFGYTPWNLG